MKCLAAFLLLAMAGLAPAKAQDQIPPEDPPLASPDANSDEAGLWMQVAKAEKDIKTSTALIRDPALNKYVQGVACRIAADACASLRVYILEAPDFNITSLPNGAIILWSGALLRIEDEAQLAHLLGHEIAHYLHRDSLDQLDRRLNTSGVAALLGVAAAGLGYGFVGTGASIAALSVDYTHSESQERDADASGLAMASAGDYDPAAGAALWQAVAAEEDAGARKDRDIFLKVHPRPNDRIPALTALAEAAPKRAFWKDGRQSWRAAIAPFEEQWIGDELRRGEPRESVVLFTRLGKGDPARGLYRYALGEAYRKRALPGDDALALTAFKAALSFPDAPPQAWRGLGLMAMQNGDSKQARIAFTHYRAGAPHAQDKAMIDYYLAQL